MNIKVASVSHITFVVNDIDRMTLFLCEGLGAREVFDNNDLKGPVPREKFFVLGDTWLAAIAGESPAERSYQHVAFKVSSSDLAYFESKLRGIGVDIKPPRPRVAGEAESLYFYDFDNHLFELHKKDLEGIFGEFKEYKSFESIIKVEYERYQNTDTVQ